MDYCIKFGVARFVHESLQLHEQNIGQMDCGKNGHFNLLSEWLAVRDQPRYGSQVGGKTGSGSSGSKRFHESDASDSNYCLIFLCFNMGNVSLCKSKGNKLIFSHNQKHKFNLTKKSMDPSEFPFDIEAYKKQSEIKERYIVNQFRERIKNIEEEHASRSKRKYFKRDHVAVNQRMINDWNNIKCIYKMKKYLVHELFCGSVLLTKQHHDAL
uniref:Uncharacterized protein n=2 Tax=Brassica campestris TaxID=3711 RepID=A0A3P6C3C0_BRACM|nr:unnamed protein product [Brassica rapa]